MKRHCINCRRCIEITVPPSPGGLEDGVNCDSREVAATQDALEEFNESGFVNYYRVEVIDGDEAECEFFEPREIVREQS